MTDAVITREHAGLLIEYVWETEPGFANPMDNDNAGRILSWSRDFSGDESIRDPDDCEITCDACKGYGEIAGGAICAYCDGSGDVPGDISRYFAEHYGAALTLPLRYSDYGSSGARIYVDSDDPNCALVFSAEEIAREWPVPTSAPEDRPESMRDYVGGIEAARAYGEARISELDSYLSGDVYGIVIRAGTEEDPGEVLESVWGFIGDPFNREFRAYLDSESDALAEGCRAEIDHEREEAHKWACADVETIA